ncbi:hypothetical protein GW17_00027803 [Ensete ventricosum]|nr:hypothetical protein GW17_00027803 [Ensete ventricosum]
MCVGGGRPLELRRQARHRLELSVRVERVRAADGVFNLLSPFPPRERPRGGVSGRRRMRKGIRVERKEERGGPWRTEGAFEASASATQRARRATDCRCGGSHGGGGQGGDTGFRGRSLGGIVVVVDGGETEAKRQPLADPRLPGYE